MLKFNAWLFLFGFLYLSCKQEINNLQFVDSVQDVKSNLVKMMELLDSLPDASVKNYFITAEDHLFINNLDCGEYASLKEIKNYRAGMLSEKKTKSFFELIDYLKRNYISGAYLSYDGYWLFGYKDNLYNDFNYSRDICIINSIKDSTRLNSRYYMLDVDENIALLKARDVLQRRRARP
jgi:hypothetical protein